MAARQRSHLRAVKLGLAGFLLGTFALVLAQQPLPWPSWPTVGGVAANPILWAPLLLGVAAIAGAVLDGLGVGSMLTALLAIPPVLLAPLTIAAYTAGGGGGVAWGGFVTLLVGVVLALAVVVRHAIAALDRRGAFDGLRERAGVA